MEENNTGAAAPTRPAFLKVLCILSYIGTGLGIIGGIWHLIGAGKAQESMAMLSGMSSGVEGTPGMEAMGGLMDSAMKMAKYAYVLAGLELVCNLLCLFGVMQMWKLKKMGFFIYTAAQLIGFIVPIALVGFGLFGGIMIVMAIFPIAFVVMYGLNLKHMH